MILWTSRPRTEDVAEFPNIGRRSWRNTIQVTWRSISWEPEWMLVDQPEPKWSMTGQDYVILTLSKKFRLKQSHDYYDGPHCGYFIGWLIVAHSLRWCKRCMPDD